MSQPEPADQAAAVAPDPHRALCDRGIANREDFTPPVFAEDTRDTLDLRRRWLMEADRELFVAFTADVVKDGKVIATKGAPYLLIACGPRITEYTRPEDRAITGVSVLSLDLQQLGLPAENLDFAPTAFVFPPAQKYKFDAALAFSLATPDDRAKVPGSQKLLDKRYRCADVGIGACQDAEDRVLARAWTPDQDERKKDACWAAKKKAIAKCFPPKDQKKFDAMGRKLWTLVEAHEADERAALEAKLSE